MRKRNHDMASTPLKAADHNQKPTHAPSKEEAMDAVRTLIRWAGIIPSAKDCSIRPSASVEAYEEFFEGSARIRTILWRVPLKRSMIDEMVLLENMRLESHCEHHMVAIIGRAHIAYLPDRIRRHQQARPSARCLWQAPANPRNYDRANPDTINRVLQPKGVAVVINAKHNA